MYSSLDTFKYFDENDPGEYITWYQNNRRKLVERLIRVQQEGEFRRNTVMFDQWLTTDTSLKRLSKQHGVSKRQVRALLLKQLGILHPLWEKERDGRQGS